jgi:hypothetical protein
MKGTCPKCNGSLRMPVNPEAERWKKIIAGYNPVDDTFPCDNCGGQYMSLKPTGVVPLRADGTPCLHRYGQRKTIRNCLNEYKCDHCGDVHQIDSSD